MPGRSSTLTRKEFDLLAELARNRGTVVTREDLMSRVWDTNWFGSTKTLDVHVGGLRRKLGDDPDRPDPYRDGPRRRLSLRRAGGRVTVSLRRTLLLAIAYVLLLAVVALGVPLAVSLRDRVDAEVRSQARSQADVVAASANEALEHGDDRGLQRLDHGVGGVGPRAGDHRRLRRPGRRRQRAGPASAGTSYASRPEIAAALDGRRSTQQTRHSDTLDADILATAVPVLERRASRSARCG